MQFVGTVTNKTEKVIERGGYIFRPYDTVLVCLSEMSYKQVKACQHLDLKATKPEPEPEPEQPEEAEASVADQDEDQDEALVSVVDEVKASEEAPPEPAKPAKPTRRRRK